MDEEEIIRVEIWLDETSQPIIRYAYNTYTKGKMFCVYCKNGKVEKYPINHLFRVIEDYESK